MIQYILIVNLFWIYIVVCWIHVCRYIGPCNFSSYELHHATKNPWSLPVLQQLKVRPDEETCLVCKLVVEWSLWTNMALKTNWRCHSNQSVKITNIWQWQWRREYLFTVIWDNSALQIFKRTHTDQKGRMIWFDVFFFHLALEYKY